MSVIKFARGTRVRVATTNGGRVTGVIANEVSVDLSLTDAPRGFACSDVRMTSVMNMSNPSSRYTIDGYRVSSIVELDKQTHTADELAKIIMGNGWVAIWHTMRKGVFVLASDENEYHAGVRVPAIQYLSTTSGKVATKNYGSVMMCPTKAMDFTPSAPIL